MRTKAMIVANGSSVREQKKKITKINKVPRLIEKAQTAQHRLKGSTDRG